MTLLAQHICCDLLGIDPKTLRRWLALAHLSFLRSPLDARLRCLTPAHLHYLAAVHDRPLSEPVALDNDGSSDQVKEEEPDPLPSSASLPPPQQSSQEIASLQRAVQALQEQLTQLTLDLLHERTKREEQQQRATSALLSSPPRSPSQAPLPHLPEELPVPAPSKPPAHPSKGRPRSLIPLIASQADGSYLVVSPQYGEVSILPDSREWFAWLDTLTSFRFVGQQGRLSAYRKSDRRFWMAYRRLHGHISTFSLGPTHQLTLGRLEHMAVLLQAGSPSSTT